MKIETQNMKEIELAIKAIEELEDKEIQVLERIVYKEMIKREAKRMILRLIDQQK